MMYKNLILEARYHYGVMGNLTVTKGAAMNHRKQRHPYQSERKRKAILIIFH